MGGSSGMTGRAKVSAPAGVAGVLGEPLGDPPAARGVEPPLGPVGASSASTQDQHTRQAGPGEEDTSGCFCFLPRVTAN